MKKNSIIMIFLACSLFVFADFTTGNQLFIEKKYAQARTVFMQEPTDFQCQYGIAVTSQFLGDYTTAIEYYKKTLATKSDFFNGLMGLAFCYQAVGDIPQAIVTTQMALQQKKLEKLYISLGQLYLDNGDLDSAKSYVNSGLVLFPDSVRLVNLSKVISRKQPPKNISGNSVVEEMSISKSDSGASVRDDVTKNEVASGGGN
ncbi:MAG: tetratricopeptide repeat protein [Fusobacteria bacterium]|nr:tetratricopeptide repeat protein [Fusobacteriota bacterium]